MADIPFTLQVRVPEPRIRGFGVYSVSNNGAFSQPAIRFAEPDRLIAQKAADLLGVKFTTFVRESSIEMAKAILRHAAEHQKENSNVHANGPDG